MLQKCYKNATKMLQKCYKKHALISPDLPKPRLNRGQPSGSLHAMRRMAELLDRPGLPFEKSDNVGKTIVNHK